jgi:hypothetical protein
MGAREAKIESLDDRPVLRVRSTTMSPFPIPET